MIFRGATMPLKMVRLPVVRLATISKNVLVSPMEEDIVDAYVDQHENQEEEEEGRLLIEMYPNLPYEYGCVLAPMIVNVANSTTMSVHLSNLHSYPVVVRKDSIVCQMEPLDVANTISRYENAKEKGNFSQHQEGCC